MAAIPVKTLYVGGSITEVDNERVLHSFIPDPADFNNVSQADMQRMKMPYEFAITKSEKTSSGIAVYGRYNQNIWLRVSKFDDFVIAAMARLLTLKTEI